MPLVIHPRVRKAVRRGAAAACLALIAGSGTALAHSRVTPAASAGAGAAATCPAQPLSTPFAKWSDTNAYFLIPGGAFDTPAAQTGWTLSGATVTPGDGPSPATGTDQALTIPAGGRATSPYFCLDDTMSDIRFFAEPTQPGVHLSVQALVRNGSGTFTVPLGALRDGTLSAWAPTPPLVLPTARLTARGPVAVALRFEVRGSGGTWRIDGIFVDPFRAG